MNKILNNLSFLPENLYKIFETMDSEISCRINEIRIRRGKQLILVIKNTSYFLDCNGDLYESPNYNCVIVKENEFDEIFMSICDYSIHNNMDSLKKGFITLPTGARVGVASTAVNDKNQIISVKDVLSLNVRIPQEVIGCSENILNFLYVNNFPSVIVAGKPNSGKTTLLRDMARMLSDGFNNTYRKIAIIDERNEFAGKNDNQLTMNVGENTDVLTNFSKPIGIELATRTLSPEMIICDEISSDNEVESILYAFSSGISFALSVHICDRADLAYKPIIKKLLETQEFAYIILLDNYTYVPEIIEASEVLSEIYRNDNTNNLFNHTGITFI